MLYAWQVHGLLVRMTKLIFLGTTLEIWNYEIIDNLYSSTG